MRVLVTRPEPGASRTASRLMSLGHEPIVLPLSETTGVPVKGADLPNCDVVAVTSANALRYTPRALLPSLTSKPLFAVGAETAAAAREAGFDDVVEGPGDATGLATSMQSGVRPGAAILYLCGRVRHPAFETALGAVELNVTPVETYDVARVAWSDAEVLGSIGSAMPDAVLLHSAVAAAAYGELAGRATLARVLASPRIICLSQRIASAVGAAQRGAIRVATIPAESALLALLTP